METRRPRLVLIHGGEPTAAGPVTRLGLKNPQSSSLMLWTAVITKVLLLVAVLAAIHSLRH